MARRVAFVACCLAFASLVQAALPPGFGGSLRIPATVSLTTPHPTKRGSPFEATLAAMVYEPLWALGEWTQEPEGWLRMSLHDFTRRQDQRPIRLSQIAQSIRAVSNSPERHWLAPLAGDGSDRALRESVVVRDDALWLHTDGAPLAFRRWLSSHALAFAATPSIGTGPFRPRRRGDRLDLLQFRSAGNGAPYLRLVQFQGPMRESDELRRLILGELDGSWVGASLFDERPRTPMGEHVGGPEATVLLIPSPARRRELGALESHLDRRRLARVGVRPSRQVHSAYPPPQHGQGRTIEGSRRLIYRAGDRFAQNLAEALVARFDEVRLRVQAIPVPAARWTSTIAANQYDFRVAQVVPALDGGAIRMAACFAAAGEHGRAGRILRATLRSRQSPDAQDAAPSLPALVLGHRTPTLFLPSHVRNIRRDRTGHLRFDRMHLPRAAARRGSR